MYGRGTMYVASTNNFIRFVIFASPSIWHSHLQYSSSVS